MKTKLLLVLLALLLLVPSLFAATTTVATTADSGPGSLREAILDANATEELDLIQFDMPGVGVQTIAPLTPLPAISFPVMIDGYSQPGASSNTLANGNNAVLRVELSGTNAGAAANGLVVYASNCVVRGLVINRFAQNGIFVIGHENTFAGNFIGTDPAGNLGHGNGQGGIFLVQSSRNLVGGTAPADRNVISANDTGVFITDLPGVSNRVEGNYIGVNATGSTALGNATHGVRVNYSSGNTIGGLSAGAGNVISGNGFPSGGGGIGIWYESATDNRILGNRVGTDAAGTAAIPNLGGIGLQQTSGTVIGGTTPSARNIVSGNSGAGIGTYRSSFVVIEGNYIGTDVNGSAPLGNENDGVAIYWSTNNLIGGTAPGAGNVISGNGLNGVGIGWVDSASSNNVVEGNIIGLDRTATVGVPNGRRFGYSGVDVIGSSHNRIGGTTPAARNVISGNVGAGVRVGGIGARQNVIAGNFIGTDGTGLAARGNGNGGVVIHDTPGNIVGARNVISGNQVGVLIFGGNATGNVIEGNIVGLDAAGLNAVGNQEGVNVVSTSNNRIGGTSAMARNLISGNAAYGVLLNGGASANEIFGNYIGTRADGLTAVGNGLAGVAMDAAPGNFIGGGSAGQGNLISGNGIGATAIGGVYLFQPASQNNIVAGNRIGTDPTGLMPVPNHVGVTFNGAANNRIGGVAASDGNVIAFNAYLGVMVYGASATGNAILQNSIFQNAGLGIDLGPDGPTSNDAGDADDGPNQSQNFPLLTLVSVSPGGVTLQGLLNSRSGTPYRLDFYANAPCDSSGHGEGAVHRGTTSVTTDGNGYGSFNISLPPAAPGMRAFTATATDPAGNTSEFSPCASPRFVINSVLPLVSTQRTFSLGGFVNSEDQRVTRTSYRHNEGPEQTVCENCGANPEFRINLTLSGTCSNNPVTITAHGEFGGVATLSGSIRFEDQTLALQCPDKVLAGCGNASGAVVNYVVTASGGEGLTPVCTPPSGALFPPGTTAVECSVANACGTVARCSFPVTVIDSSGLLAPGLIGVVPAAVPESQATWITVRGENLNPIDEVLVHGTALRNAIFVNAQEIQGELSALPAGAYDVQIRRCGNVAAQLVGGVSAGLKPVIQSIEPTQVYARGGFVSLRGKNFRSDTQVRIGFPAVTDGANLIRKVTVAPDGLSIVGEAPPLPAGQLFGPRDVIVEDARGQSVLAAGLSYIPNPVETDAQVLALRAVETVSVEPVSVSFRNGFPIGMNVRVPVPGANPEERARNFLRTHKDLFLQSNPDADLSLHRVRPGVITHVSLLQHYGSLPVLGCEIVVSMVGNEIFGVTGLLVPTARLATANFPETPRLSSQEAELMARTHFNRLNLTTERPSRLEILDLTTLGVLPDPSLPTDPVRVWRVHLMGARAELFVHTETGQVVFELPLHMEEGGLDGFSLEIEDAEDEANGDDDCCFNLSAETYVGSEDGLIPRYQNVPDAINAWWHIRNTYSFFNNHFGWKSYDNDESTIDIFIHSSVNSGRWVEGFIACELMEFRRGRVDFESITHEYTHGIIYNGGSELLYRDTSGALNESYADLMAVVADRELDERNGAPLNWWFAEDRTVRTLPTRDISNPTNRNTEAWTPQPGFVGVGQADRNSQFDSQYTSWPFSRDSGGVHYFSGIPNKAGYLMAEGGLFNGVLVRPMGLAKMRDLKFHALLNVPRRSWFSTARDWEVATARAWAASGQYGFTAADVCTVRQAWFAVEVGDGDFNCDGVEDRRLDDIDKDGFLPGIDNCPLIANPDQKDADSAASGGPDGVGDLCDNCPTRFNPGQENFDRDDKGDVCDEDLDGDGCLNERDQHRDNNLARTGTLVRSGCCGNRNDNVFTSEEGYSDDDSLPDCEDLDDDNDGLLDDGPDRIPGNGDPGEDPCPTISRYLAHLSCSVTVDCPCVSNRREWQDTCIICDDVFARFRIVNSPDPAQEVIFDHVQIVNRTLYVAPSAGNTVQQIANALRFRLIGFAPAGADANLLRIELWSRPTATEPSRLLSVVGEFDPAMIDLGQLAAGSFLALTPLNDASLAVNAVWSPGADPATATRDTDMDGMLDGWEIQHSLNPRNPSDAALDSDGDGVSNLDEFRAGSSPSDAQSLFRITQVRSLLQGLQVEFRAVPGRLYQVERAPALGQRLPWQPVGDALRAMGGNVIRDIPTTESSAGFYRVGLVPE